MRSKIYYNPTKNYFYIIKNGNKLKIQNPPKQVFETIKRETKKVKSQRSEAKHKKKFNYKNSKRNNQIQKLSNNIQIYNNINGMKDLVKSFTKKKFDELKNKKVQKRSQSIQRDPQDIYEYQRNYFTNDEFNYIRNQINQERIINQIKQMSQLPNQILDQNFANQIIKNQIDQNLKELFQNQQKQQKGFQIQFDKQFNEKQLENKIDFQKQVFDFELMKQKQNIEQMQQIFQRELRNQYEDNQNQLKNILKQQQQQKIVMNQELQVDPEELENNYPQSFQFDSQQQFQNDFSQSNPQSISQNNSQSIPQSNQESSLQTPVPRQQNNFKNNSFQQQLQESSIKFEDFISQLDSQSQEQQSQIEKIRQDFEELNQSLQVNNFSQEQQDEQNQEDQQQEDQQQEQVQVQKDKEFIPNKDDNTSIVQPNQQNQQMEDLNQFQNKSTVIDKQNILKKKAFTTNELQELYRQDLFEKFKDVVFYEFQQKYINQFLQKVGYENLDYESLKIFPSDLNIIFVSINEKQNFFLNKILTKQDKIEWKNIEKNINSQHTQKFLEDNNIQSNIEYIYKYMYLTQTQTENVNIQFDIDQKNYSQSRFKYIPTKQELQQMQQEIQQEIQKELDVGNIEDLQDFNKKSKFTFIQIQLIGIPIIQKNFIDKFNEFKNNYIYKFLLQAGWIEQIPKESSKLIYLNDSSSQIYSSNNDIYNYLKVYDKIDWETIKQINQYHTQDLLQKQKIPLQSNLDYIYRYLYLPKQDKDKLYLAYQAKTNLLEYYPNKKELEQIKQKDKFFQQEKGLELVQKNEDEGQGKKIQNNQNNLQNDSYFQQKYNSFDGITKRNFQKYFYEEIAPEIEDEFQFAIIEETQEIPQIPKSKLESMTFNICVFFFSAQKDFSGKHFTVFIHDNEMDQIYYFDPLSPKQNDQFKLAQTQIENYITQFNQLVGHSIPLKVKINRVNVQQTDFSKGSQKNDQNFCGIYSLIFIYRICVEEQTFKQASEFKQNSIQSDKQEQELQNEIIIENNVGKGIQQKNQTNFNFISQQ